MTTDRLDPQLAELLQRLQDAGTPQLQTLSPRDAREVHAKGSMLFAGAGAKIARQEDRKIDSGERQIDVRIYYPDDPADELPPLLVYFHGGGWSFGSIATHDSICRTLCANCSSIVASVEYGLSPEHKFPQAVFDAVAASEWACSNARSLGADVQRIVLAGDSAGANLATVAARLVSEEGNSPIFCQLLIYPATDMTMSFHSHQAFGDGYRLTRPLMVWSASNYLRDGRDMMDPRASPLFAEDLSGLPPAIVITAGFDPLKDEGEAYAAKLVEAGVDVESRCFDSLIHGFVSMTGVVDAAATALDEITQMLKERLECHT